ncbi:MAG: 1-acyl-sn-glycerol-3-phosphate acyltransferase [Candidatus Omnitrophica bacterium]|nr:1-acyl-sn-glycerol-3-phosphate acyltransferase [Candidatus Omnitrophota bacterium]
MRIVLSMAVWAVGFILTVILFLVMLFLTLALYPFDKKRKIVHAQCYWWADALTILNPYWKVSVTGLENIDKGKTYVIVVNHQSLADIIILYKTKMQFKWVAKESLFKVPFVGWCLSLAKHIKLSRGEFSSIKKAYRDAANWLRNGVSVLFFPEGTRSETNEMREFQNGAFKIALKERKPILPIVLDGTRRAIPKGSWVFAAKVQCRLRVLPAIDSTAFGAAEFDRLKNITRTQLAAASS